MKSNASYLTDNIEGSSTSNSQRDYEPLLRAVQICLGMDGALLSLIEDERERVLASYGVLPGAAYFASAPGLSAARAGEVIISEIAEDVCRTTSGEACRAYLAISFRVPGKVPGKAPDSVPGKVPGNVPGRANGEARRGVLAVTSKEPLSDDSLREKMEKLAAFGDLAACQIECKATTGREKRLAEQMQQARKMEVIGQLAGGIAHDFNNLLTVINGYTTILIDRARRENGVRRELDHIRNAGERAAQLTQQLLAFGRKQVLQPRILDLNQVVTGMQSMLTRVIPEDIELKTRLDPALAPVKADPAQIEQVIINLAINARDAMPQGGQLQIETSNVELDEKYASAHLDLAPGRYVLLSVSDTGTGMTPEVLSRIFEPFFTTKPKGQGTGLGLPTVFGIVKQSGGHLAVYTEPGFGSIFKIYLPLADEASRSLDAMQVANITALRGSETILLVEDDENVREYTATLLGGLGYRVLTASNGHDALRIEEGHAQPIQLLLTDVVMPKMSGRELSVAMRERRKGLQVLYTSGYTQDTLLHRGALDAGIAYLQKPFTFRELAERVRSTLDDTVRRQRILLVDDDEVVREFLGRVLEGAGYRVIKATDGREAIKIYRQEPPDLVLTDLIMPGQEGIETIQILRRESPQLKIIAMSGAVGGPVLNAARHLGASRILAKPLAAGELLEAVRELIG